MKGTRSDLAFTDWPERREETQVTTTAARSKAADHAAESWPQVPELGAADPPTAEPRESRCPSATPRGLAVQGPDDGVTARRELPSAGCIGRGTPAVGPRPRRRLRRRRAWSTGRRITTRKIKTGELEAVLRRPLTSGRTIAVISAKGGVGNTTVALNLGHTFAALREDRVVAVDASPDVASLAHRIRRDTDATIVELLTGMDGCDDLSYADVRRYTCRASSRLEVLAAPGDPELSRVLGASEYGRTLTLLADHYALILADCATGVLNRVTQRVLGCADQVVVVTAPSVDAARTAGALLSWLAGHGRADLAEQAVLAVNAAPAKTGRLNLGGLERHFGDRVRAVVRIPRDDHLETGARTAIEHLRPETRRAYVRLAAAVADGFTVPG